MEAASPPHSFKRCIQMYEDFFFTSNMSYFRFGSEDKAGVSILAPAIGSSVLAVFITVPLSLGENYFTYIRISLLFSSLPAKVKVTLVHKLLTYDYSHRRLDLGPIADIISVQHVQNACWYIWYFFFVITNLHKRWYILL